MLRCEGGEADVVDDLREVQGVEVLEVPME